MLFGRLPGQDGQDLGELFRACLGVVRHDQPAVGASASTSSASLSTWACSSPSVT